LGVVVWGLGALAPTPNPQSPIPNPQLNSTHFLNRFKIKKLIIKNKLILFI